jgi:hypothetical protein
VLIDGAVATESFSFDFDFQALRSAPLSRLFDADDSHSSATCASHAFGRTRFPAHFSRPIAS